MLCGPSAISCYDQLHLATEKAIPMDRHSVDICEELLGFSFVSHTTTAC